jgi:hypothetical protein
MPLVTSDEWGGMALGWWDGNDWVRVDAESSLPVQGGEDYKVALLGSDQVIVGGPPEDRGCDIYPDPIPGVPFDDDGALSAIIDDGAGGELAISGVAVSASWDISPRPVEEGQASPEADAVALALLTARGITRDSASIVQALSADLDGDGAVESVVVAEDTELANSASDVYSIVFVMSPTSPDPVIVEESVFSPEDSGYPESMRVSALADMNGDGSLEVVVSENFFEGSGVSVHERSGEGYERRIGAGCGA